MVEFFKLSAVSKKRHLELVEEKSDIYDSPEVYGLNYQEKILGGNGSSASPYKIEVSIQNTSGIDFEGIMRLEIEAASESDGKADFYLPGFMYGSNRGDKPWKVDCKFPRLNSAFTLLRIIAKKILYSMAALFVIPKGKLSAIPSVMKMHPGFLLSHIQFFQDKLQKLFYFAGKSKNYTNLLCL